MWMHCTCCFVFSVLYKKAELLKTLTKQPKRGYRNKTKKINKKRWYWTVCRFLAEVVVVTSRHRGGTRRCNFIPGLLNKHERSTLSQVSVSPEAHEIKRGQMTGRIRRYITISNFLRLKLENAITAKLELCVALVQTESNCFQKWAEQMSAAHVNSG